MELKKGEIYMVVVDGMAYAFGSSLVLAKFLNETEDYIELESPVVLVQIPDAQNRGVGAAILPLPIHKEKKIMTVNKKYLISVFEPDIQVKNNYIQAVSGLTIASGLSEVKGNGEKGNLISA